MESNFQPSMSVSNIRRFLKMDNMLCNYMTDEVLCLINFDCWPIIQQITADVAIREVSETQLFTFYFQTFKSHLLNTPQLFLNTSELKMQWLIWDLIHLFVCLLFMLIYVILCFIIIYQLASWHKCPCDNPHYLALSENVQKSILRYGPKCH